MSRALRQGRASATRLGLTLAAALTAATGACQGPDPYYRSADAGSGPTGQAGTGGLAGGGGKGGAAGTGAAGASPSGGAGMGAAGTGAAGNTSSFGGTAGTSGTCAKCMVTVRYTCRSVDKTQASFVLNVVNNASASFALSDLTLRYWYTVDPSKPQTLDCDFAELGCTNVSASANQVPAPVPRFEPVMPPRPGANSYVEMSFSAGALSLDPFLDTGEIQLRLHDKDFLGAINQMDDYSFDGSMMGNPIDGTKITAYIKGVLVWGIEPQ